MDPQNYAVERLKRDILWLGHNKIILKTDNEHAILSVLRNTLKALRIEGLESSQESHPAAYDPSSNGSTEIACRTIGGMIATLRACLESRIRKQLPVAHCGFAWLVEHAAWLHTIKKKQSDGITAYHRLRGRSFGPKLLGFGERCLFMLQRKSQDRSLEGKLGSKWKEGIFLGYSRDSNECLLWNSENKGVVKARIIKRKPESQ